MTEPLRNGKVGLGIWLALCWMVYGCEASGGLPRAGETASARPDAAVVVTDQATAAGHVLEIRTVKGACVLHAASGTGAPLHELQLVPKAPCHFLRVPGEDSPQIREYADVGTEGVLIVSGTPASQASRTLWKLEPGLVCGEESQGVLVRAGRVLITRAVRKGGITCRDKGVDEKEYWAFAHDEK